MPCVGALLTGSLSFRYDIDLILFYFSIQQTVAVSRDLSPVSGQLWWASCALECTETWCCLFCLAGAEQCCRQLVLFEGASVHWKYRDMSRIKQNYFN